MKGNKGIIYVEGAHNMKELIELLTRNDYTTQVRWIDGIDAFHMEYEVKYKRRGYEE